MKQYSMNARFCLLTLLVVLGAASCKKDSDTAIGPPSITRVATSTDRAANLSSGALNQWLIVWGTSLATAQQVSFNDLVVKQEDFFATDSTVSVKIPRQVPGTATNTLTIKTKGGEATYNFKLEIPQLYVKGIRNEYVLQGDTLEITGDYFDLYGFEKAGTVVTFTGGATASLTEATATALKLVVPAGAQPGPLAIKGVAPLNTQATTSAWYQDNRNYLFDMNSFSGSNGSSYISSGPVPATLSTGPYFKISKSWDGGWAWAPFCTSNAAIPADIVINPANVSNYVLKFEMNISASDAALPRPLNIVFQGNGFKDTDFDPSGAAQFPFNTKGKWETFACPMSAFAGYNFKNPSTFEIMLKGADPFQSDFAICNFRIVPK